VIGRYERNEIKPSVEIANKIALALDISLDYLVGNNSVIVKDKKILKRMEAIAMMREEQQTALFNVIDALIRDYNSRESIAFFDKLKSRSDKKTDINDLLAK